MGIDTAFSDIAIKDRKKPGRYILGIECDGATHHSSQSAFLPWGLGALGDQGGIQYLSQLPGVRNSFLTYYIIRKYSRLTL